MYEPAVGALTGSVAQERVYDDVTVLYAVTAPRMVRLAFLLTSDKAFAEDVVQEVFVRVASRLGRLRDINAVEAYLRRAVVNEILGSRRSLARRQRRQQTAAAAVSCHTSPMDRVEARIDLVQALNRLPLQQRTAILLKYWMDLGEAEIAETMNCAVGTVKSRLSRGLDTLREVTDDES